MSSPVAASVYVTCPFFLVGSLCFLGEGGDDGMQDLFTYAYLSTLAGAVTATVLVVDFIKGLGFLKHFSTRCLVVVVAEGIVFLVDIAAGSFKMRDVPLCILNGLLVAASAMGSWQVIHDRLFGDSVKKRGG